MQFDITWTITAIIAVSSFISPIAVAIINNRHHAKIRKLELEHDEKLRRLDLQQQVAIRQGDIYYADKKQAFSDFVNAAGFFLSHPHLHNSYQDLESSLNKTLLFCNEANQNKLLDFLDYANSVAFTNVPPSSFQKEYNQLLTEISILLNKELESTKPVIECK